MFEEIICFSVSEQLKDKNIVICEIQNLNLNRKLEQLVWKKV